MNKVLKLGDTDVEMRASALTPILYNNFFNKDFYEEYNNALKMSKLFTGEIAFIMHIQASEEHPLEYVSRASMDDYYNWLEQFDLADMADNFIGLMEVLLKANFSSAKAKKKNG